MLKQRHFANLLPVIAIILRAISTIRAANGAEPFMLTSSAFKDGTPMPKKHANNTQGNANCVGENVSPPLAWSNPPAGTKSFALIMVDPEGKGGTGRNPLGRFGYPGSVPRIGEGQSQKPIR